MLFEFNPDTKLAGEIFDSLPKTDLNWPVMVSTAGVLLADVYMAGGENKPKKIEMFVVYPESQILHKRRFGYKITIEQTED